MRIIKFLPYVFGCFLLVVYISIFVFSRISVDPVPEGIPEDHIVLQTKMSGNAVLEEAEAEGRTEALCKRRNFQKKGYPFNEFVIQMVVKVDDGMISKGSEFSVEPIGNSELDVLYKSKFTINQDIEVGDRYALALAIDMSIEPRNFEDVEEFIRIVPKDKKIVIKNDLIRIDRNCFTDYKPSINLAAFGKSGSGKTSAWITYINACLRRIMKDVPQRVIYPPNMPVGQEATERTRYTTVIDMDVMKKLNCSDNYCSGKFIDFPGAASQVKDFGRLVKQCINGNLPTKVTMSISEIKNIYDVDLEYREYSPEDKEILSDEELRSTKIDGFLIFVQSNDVLDNDFLNDFKNNVMAHFSDNNLIGTGGTYPYLVMVNCDNSKEGKNECTKKEFRKIKKKLMTIGIPSYNIEKSWVYVKEIDEFRDFELEKYFLEKVIRKLNDLIEEYRYFCMVEELSSMFEYLDKTEEMNFWEGILFQTKKTFKDFRILESVAMRSFMVELRKRIWWLNVSTLVFLLYVIFDFLSHCFWRKGDNAPRNDENAGDNNNDDDDDENQDDDDNEGRGGNNNNQDDNEGGDGDGKEPKEGDNGKKNDNKPKEVTPKQNEKKKDNEKNEKTENSGIPLNPCPGYNWKKLKKQWKQMKLEYIKNLILKIIRQTGVLVSKFRSVINSREDEKSGGEDPKRENGN